MKGEEARTEGELQGARIEAPKVPSGVGYGKGCPLRSRLGGLGERRELPQRGPRPETHFERIFGS